MLSRFYGLLILSLLTACSDSIVDPSSDRNNASRINRTLDDLFLRQDYDEGDLITIKYFDYGGLKSDLTDEIKTFDESVILKNQEFHTYLKCSTAGNSFTWTQEAGQWDEDERRLPDYFKNASITYLIKVGNEGIPRLNMAQVMLITHTPMYVESLSDFTSVVPFFFWLDDANSLRNDDTLIVQSKQVENSIGYESRGLQVWLEYGIDHSTTSYNIFDRDVSLTRDIQLNINRKTLDFTQKYNKNVLDSSSRGSDYSGNWSGSCEILTVEDFESLFLIEKAYFDKVMETFKKRVFGLAG
jgi:hypothetical protein